MKRNEDKARQLYLRRTVIYLHFTSFNANLIGYNLINKLQSLHYIFMHINLYFHFDLQKYSMNKLISSIIQ